jgi:hypothetical protein
MVSIAWVNFAIGVPVLTAIITAIVFAIRHRGRRSA